MQFLNWSYLSVGATCDAAANVYSVMASQLFAWLLGPNSLTTFSWAINLGQTMCNLINLSTQVNPT